MNKLIIFIVLLVVYACNQPRKNDLTESVVVEQKMNRGKPHPIAAASEGTRDFQVGTFECTELYFQSAKAQADSLVGFMNRAT